MVYVLVGALTLALAAAVLYNFMMKKELSSLAAVMERDHAAGTYRQMRVGVPQRQIARVAASINRLYSDIDADRAATRSSIEEIHEGIANISHDLRTPLTSIIGYLKLIQNEETSDEKKSDYLHIAYQKEQSLNILVSGLFELSVLESGKNTVRYQRVDANATLAEELASSYVQFDKLGVSPTLQLYEAPLWVIGDSDMLHRVFANLLQNMIKHGQPPMELASGIENGAACFRFSNKAPELLEKDVPLIFKRFFTADRMRSGKGTGLGLAIVKECVEQMGGHIFAEQEQGVLTISLFFDLRGPQGDKLPQ